jgi:hypothetical protein
MRRPLILSVYVRLSGLAIIMAATPGIAQDNDLMQARQQEWLAAHNAARTEVGFAPLRWSAELAEDAGTWANHLVSQRLFHHAPEEVLKGQGENLWRGTRGSYSPEQMIFYFVTEKHNFRTGVFPDVSRTGRWRDVGHYTQIIWPKTRKVGCALAADRDQEVLVCRYWPAGNIMGYNIKFPKRSSRP